MTIGEFLVYRHVGLYVVVVKNLRVPVASTAVLVIAYSICFTSLYFKDGAVVLTS